METLQNEILQKCKTETELLSLSDQTENDGYKDLYEEDIASIKTEELLFEDILAEKRRKYTTKEEFIYSLYNSILPAFIAKWDGHPLRKERFAEKFSQDDVKVIEKNEKIDDYNKHDLFIKEEEKGNNKIISVPSEVSSWNLSLPNEFVNIKFYNNNSYCGRISRKMMEGEGTYTWHNGVQYKGQFERNKIQGEGLLKWNNNCWYEGNFMNGFRHGKGILVDKENNRIYLGQWHMGHLRGKE